uniref:Uncharacterized protein n=1 Tax=Octopus bimaculoides TaxID=37653 RepID=A0A0L8IBD5_OCTBM
MTRAAVLNRIATRVIQRLILMMNETHMLIPPNSVKNIHDVLLYLSGGHEDVGMSGDRGDFYRRKLAEQIYLNFAIQGIDHYNVIAVIKAAIDLEEISKLVMFGELSEENIAIDDRMFSILARISGFLEVN